MTSAAAATDAVDADVVAFLVALGGALHKQRAYPSGHPMRQAAHAAAFRLLAGLLREDPELRIGVARRQLIVREQATDTRHFVLQDLVLRLRRRQIGAIAFHRGITEESFSTFLERLAEGAVGGAPEPFDPASLDLPNLEVSPIAFDALALGGKGGTDGGSELDRLWHDLAAAVGEDYFNGTGWGRGDGGGSVGDDAEESLDPSDAAFGRALLERLSAPGVRQQVTAAFERLGRMTQALDGPERAAAETRFGRLLATLPKDALTVLLDLDVGQREGQAGALKAVEWLPAMALVELVEAAARSQQRDISSVLLRLLQKLARKSPVHDRARALGERDLRMVVKGLMEDWTLADPNSRSHAHILEVLSRFDSDGTAEGAANREFIRILQIAVEVGTTGDHVTEAVEDAIAAGQTGRLVALLREAGSGPVVEEIWRLVVAPQHLGRILSDADLPDDVLLAVLDHVGPAEVPALADRLLVPASRSVRVRMAERLVTMGPAAAAALAQRLETGSSEQRFQILELLGDLPELPDWLDLRSYLKAPDPLVRAQAVRLAARRFDLRDDAFHGALADMDDRVVRVALVEGRLTLSRHSVPRLILLLNSPHRSTDLKAETVEVLRRFDDPSVRQWLATDLAARRYWFSLWPTLAPKDPVVLAKLRALAAGWANDPAVARILRLARRSGDPELEAAATPPAAP